MKKIYSKFTRERALRFQIETAIYEEQDGSRCVKKHPLSSACEAHLNQIYENNLFFINQGKPFFAPCEKEEKSIIFSFIKGTSYYERLLGDVKKYDREAFFKTLEDYQKTVEQLYTECDIFENSELFASVFGNVDGLSGMKSASKVDIDLTFDNIIVMENGIAQIIDYEWMFDCLVPVKFAYFRAVQAFYMKNSVLLDGFIVAHEVYDYFGISTSEVGIFEAMNAGFMSYVNGGDRGYEILLESYKKPAASLGNGMGASLNQVTVFVNSGEGYSNDNCILTMMPDENQLVRLEVDLTAYAGAKEVRIDPLDVSVVIRMRKFMVEQQGEWTAVPIDQIIHNAIIKSIEKDGIWVFHNDDPQIILSLKGEDKMDRILLEYEVLFTNLEVFDSYINPYRERLMSAIQSEERTRQMYAYKDEKINQLMRENELLEDMVNYIQGTRIYQMLLKKKVDSIHVWDEIRDR